MPFYWESGKEIPEWICQVFALLQNNISSYPLKDYETLATRLASLNLIANFNEDGKKVGNLDSDECQEILDEYGFKDFKSYYSRKK